MTATPVDASVDTQVATTGAHRAQLRRAGMLLERFAHPGVIALVDLTDDAFTTVLKTRRIPGENLVLAGPFTAAQICGLGAAIAQTIAAMHAAGQTHGAIDAENIIVTDDGRPVLSGIGAGQIRDDPATWATVTQRDCADLGVVLERLVDQAQSPPGFMAALRARRHASTVRSIARRAVVGEITDANELARLLIGTPPSTLPTSAIEAAPDDPPTRQRSRVAPFARTIAIGATLVGLAMTAVGVARLGVSQNAPPSKVVDCKRATVPDAHLVGRTLHAAGSRYRVGKPGDVVRLGDWDGDGIATPALLRPSSGAVFMFTAWPSAGSPSRARATTRILGARTLHCVMHADTTQLVVVTASGRRVPVAPPADAKANP